MSGGAGNNWEDLSLPNQVQGSYSNALNSANMSAGAMGAVPGLVGSSGSIYSQMGGMTPQDIQAQQLSTTNLDPYMNQYTDRVLDTTLRRLNAQEALQQQKIRDQSEAQHAFGGDRMALMGTTMNKNFDDTRSDAISRIYSDSFLNAQNAAMQDINNNMTAGQANQNMRANMMSGGASGLANLAGTVGNIGLGGTQQLGNLSQQGFGNMNSIMGNQSAMGSQLQQLQQQIINAGKGQFSGYANAPTSALEFIMRGVGGLPSGVGTTTATTPSAGKSPLGTAGQAMTLMAK